MQQRVYTNGTTGSVASKMQESQAKQCVGTLYIPRAPMTSIFEGQPLKTSTFPSKTRVVWALYIEELLEKDGTA